MIGMTEEKRSSFSGMMKPNDFCMLAVWGMGCPGFFGRHKIRGPNLTTVEAGLYRSSLEAPEAFQAEYEATPRWT